MAFAPSSRIPFPATKKRDYEWQTIEVSLHWYSWYTMRVKTRHLLNIPIFTDHYPVGIFIKSKPVKFESPK
jgi:hypothetical protein